MLQKYPARTGWLVIALLMLSACVSPAPEAGDTGEEESATPQEAAAPEEPTAVPSTATPTEASPTPAPATPPEPQRIEFESGDGLSLVGTFYPPMESPAPGVLLMHQFSVERGIWEEFALILQSGEVPSSVESITEMHHYAVFAFDFPDHGESEGPFTDQAALAAARAALELFRTFDGVDPDRIINIGASIGADAAVDECNEGCIGAIPLSPGGYLGIDFTQALIALRDEKDPPVLCVASEGDSYSANACQAGESAGLSDYRTHIYDGDAHGNFILLADLEGEELSPPPQPLDLILGWLEEHIGP